jgi:dolichol-phosphate mannosyltransferase
MNSSRVLVIMPTFNEAQCILQTWSELRTALPHINILIVDDNSPDGTGDIADRLTHADNRTFVLHRTVKQGLGAAYIDGFRWAGTKDFDFVVEMDADGSHRAADLPRMLAVAEESDLVIGSRWVAGGGIENWSWHRQLLSRAGNSYVRRLLNLTVGDSTSGFRVFRSSALATIHLDSVSSTGYCFQVDMTRRFAHHGFRIREVPILFVERRAGRSKMSNAIVREALWRVAVWGLKDRLSTVAHLFSRRWGT